MSVAPPSDNPGRDLMLRFTEELLRRLSADNAPSLVSSELEVVRKFLSDNSITLAQVRKGDFGKFAQEVANEQFPFEDDAPHGTA